MIWQLVIAAVELDEIVGLRVCFETVRSRDLEVGPASSPDEQLRHIYESNPPLWLVSVEVDKHGPLSSRDLRLVLCRVGRSLLSDFKREQARVLQQNLPDC